MPSLDVTATSGEEGKAKSFPELLVEARDLRERLIRLAGPSRLSYEDHAEHVVEEVDRIRCAFLAGVGDLKALGDIGGSTKAHAVIAGVVGNFFVDRIEDDCGHAQFRQSRWQLDHTDGVDVWANSYLEVLQREVTHILDRIDNVLVHKPLSATAAHSVSSTTFLAELAGVQSAFRGFAKVLAGKIETVQRDCEAAKSVQSQFAEANQTFLNIVLADLEKGDESFFRRLTKGNLELLTPEQAQLIVAEYFIAGKPLPSADTPLPSILADLSKAGPAGQRLGYAWAGELNDSLATSTRTQLATPELFAPELG